MKKIFALVLSLALTFPPVIFSQPVETTVDAFLPLANLAIPESIGKIQERFTETGGRTIIQIQDVHAHYLAQENIAAILEHLSAVCGIQKVGLEGAWVTTDLPKSRTIPTSREKQLLARSLMEEDYISGPVYATALSPVALRLVGIEETGLYEQSRSIFLQHMAKQSAILEKIKIYENQITAEQNQSWNPGLLSFGHAFGKFRETSDFGAFFSILVKTAETEEISFSDLDQILLVREIMNYEALISKDRLEREAKQLLQQYRTSSSLNLEELLRSGKVPEEKMVFYPEIKKLTRLFGLKDKISSQDLMRQIETLAERLSEKLAKTQEEKALWNKSERFYLAKKILLLKATPADLKFFEVERAALETEAGAAGLSEALELALKFYEFVKQRDEIFYQKLMNDPELSGNVAIVTGGFHTDGLSQRFRNAGISYITITPELGGEPPDMKLYEKRMSENRTTHNAQRATTTSPAQNTPGVKLRAHESHTPGVGGVTNDQTLSELRNAIAWVDERFVTSYQILLTTKDVRKAVAAFSGHAPLSLSASRRAAAPSNLFDITKFMTQTHAEQLAIVRGWLQKLQTVHQKAMLVSEVSVLKAMLADSKVPEMIEGILQGNDVLVLAQDAPIEEVPSLLVSHGINLLKAEGLGQLINENQDFRRLAKKWPLLTVMKNGYQNDTYVVLPELPVSLILYRVIALNPNLYQAAKNLEFLKLLQDLVTEALAQAATQKAA